MKAPSKCILRGALSRQCKCSCYLWHLTNICWGISSKSPLYCLCVLSGLRPYNHEWVMSTSGNKIHSQFMLRESIEPVPAVIYGSSVWVRLRTFSRYFLLFPLCTSSNFLLSMRLFRLDQLGLTAVAFDEYVVDIVQWFIQVSSLLSPTVRS